MARWMLNLDGGPKRVNHAAVAIGDKIYSFGGYTASEVGMQNDFIDVHVLNTFTFRWERLPTLPLDSKSRRSATISGLLEEPSTSQPFRGTRRRAQSLTEAHPLALIRFSNPPLEEEESLEIESPRPAVSHESAEMLAGNGHDYMVIEMGDSGEESEQEQNESLEEEHLRVREMLGRIDEALDEIPSDYEDEPFSEPESSDDEFMDTDEYDEDDDDDDQPRMIIRVDGLGELDVPIGVDMAQLQKLKDHPEIPFKRYGHTAVEHKGQVYLWGGRNDTYGCRQTLHCYDPARNRWSIVQTQGQCPPARDGHSAIVWGDRMYIFGGYEEREMRFSQETYAFHFATNTWEKLKTRGEPPQYRDFHTACALDGKMYIFGGRSDETGQSHTSQDIYDDKFRYLDLSTLQWHLLDVKGDQKPCGRRSHTMWTYQGNILLFGGFQSNRNMHFGDLWKFDPKSCTWTEIVPTGNGPSPRRRQCTIQIGDRLFLFGGTMPNPWKKINGGSSLEDLGDLFVLDFSPTLASLCLQTIMKHDDLKKQAGIILPNILMRELQYMCTPNQISKATPRFGTYMRG